MLSLNQSMSTRKSLSPSSSRVHPKFALSLRSRPYLRSSWKAVTSPRWERETLEPHQAANGGTRKVKLFPLDVS